MSEINIEYDACLRDLGQTHQSVIVIDAGLATSMKTDLFAKAFPERYFNLGIAEQNAVGVAAGLSRRGYLPLVHTFSNFIARRAHDQLALSVAWPRCNVKFIGGSCGLFDGRNGPSHCATNDLGTVSALPGFEVVEPGDQNQMKNLLVRMVERPGPAYFRLRRHGAAKHLILGMPSDSGTVRINHYPDSRCTLVACGSMLEEVLKAARVLAGNGMPVDLFHVSILRPLDVSIILSSAVKTRLVITVENHSASGGFGDAIGRELGRLGLTQLRLNLPDEFLPAGDPDWLLQYCGLDAESIAGYVTSSVCGGVACV